MDIVTGQKSSNVVPVTLLETSKERGIAQGGATVALGAATGATTAANNPGQHFFATTTPQQQLQSAAAHQAVAQQQQQQGQQGNSYIPYQQMYTLQQQNLQPLGDNMINVREKIYSRDLAKKKLTSWKIRLQDKIVFLFWWIIVDDKGFRNYGVGS